MEVYYGCLPDVFTPERTDCSQNVVSSVEMSRRFCDARAVRGLVINTYNIHLALLFVSSRHSWFTVS